MFDEEERGWIEIVVLSVKSEVASAKAHRLARIGSNLIVMWLCGSRGGMEIATRLR